MRHCYAANGSITGTYVGGLVGEMTDNALMSYCHGYKNTVKGDYAGGISSRIIDKAKADLCFTTESNISSKGGLTNTSRCEPGVSESKMKSGELTWLLNDKTAFATIWYQNVDGEGTPNDYPVLDSKSKPVFYDGSKYTNKPSGTIFELSGKGTSKEPFLINNLSDWEFMAKYCISE